HYFNRLLGLFGFSLIIAYITQNMLHHIVDIYVLDMYQFLMLGFLSSILLVVLLAAKRLSASWILEEECI
ncbi:MAG: beta-carotene 15,15'-monooxygenase, partial [Erysipelothrix sp.]|nr:beta-carotene 15,15'-monooxygenase [Erysipelothrix sp.]